MFKLDEAALKDFLQQLGLQNFQCVKVAGDASFRSYYRISEIDFAGDKLSLPLGECLGKKQSLILMFAPPSHEDVLPFMNIANILREESLHAPAIFAHDIDLGFLLLEDFGDISFNKSMIDSQIDHEEFLYKNSIDCLSKIHQIEISNSDIKSYNHNMLFNEAMLFVDWYLQYEKNTKLSLSQIKEFKDILFKLFDQISKESRVLVLRDYHADNLMVIAESTGVDGVGILDFQDAVIGSNAYDLVSLLEDARRDVDLNLADKLIDYFLISNVKINREKFIADYKILSLQRNIKILGIFSRLARRDDKESYLEMIPRVRKHVLNRISGDDPLLQEAANFLAKII